MIVVRTEIGDIFKGQSSKQLCSAITRINLAITHSKPQLLSLSTPTPPLLLKKTMSETKKYHN